MRPAGNFPPIRKGAMAFRHCLLSFAPWTDQQRGHDQGAIARLRIYARILNKGDFTGMILYSTSPLGAFQGMLLTVVIVPGIGIVGLVCAFLQRRQGRKGWVGLGIAGAFLTLNLGWVMFG